MNAPEKMTIFEALNKASLGQLLDAVNAKAFTIEIALERATPQQLAYALAEKEDDDRELCSLLNIDPKELVDIPEIPDGVGLLDDVMKLYRLVSEGRTLQALELMQVHVRSLPFPSTTLRQAEARRSA